MIQVKNLKKSFDGIVAVDDLSFEVSPGEEWAVRYTVRYTW